MLRHCSYCTALPPLAHYSTNYDSSPRYDKVGWPLYKKYGHAYDAFKLCLTDQEDIFGDETLFGALDTVTKDVVSDYIKKRLAPQPIRVRSDIECTCFTYEGIDAIRAALAAGEAKGTEECPVQIKLIAPPMYVMTTMTLDKELGIATLEAAIKDVEAAIKASGGTLEVKMAPKAVSQREETELQAMMDRLAAEMAEVDGDDDED